MFKAIRIAILLFILFMVAMGSWLTKVRSTDWKDTLWVKIYPINGDGSAVSQRHIESLDVQSFAGVESFITREVNRHGKPIVRPVRIDLGLPVREQPPAIDDANNVLGVVLWSLKMRWWASGITDGQDRIEPDVRIFVRYHSPETTLLLENSVGMQKGMFGVVNAYASRRLRGRNNVVIAHEFLHTLGATDKYDLSNGQPLVPDGLAEPDRVPLYPQRKAEIMGGRIALQSDDAVIPKSLEFAVIGVVTAQEIRLTD